MIARSATSPRTRRGTIARDVKAATLRLLNRTTKHDRRLIRVALLSLIALAASEVYKML